jgi:glycosyltransferase XagB
VADTASDNTRFNVPMEKLYNSGISPSEWDCVFRLAKDRPDEVATRVLTRAQQIALILLVGGLALWLFLQPITCLILVNGFLIGFYLLLSAYKLYLIHLSLGAPRELRFSGEDLRTLSSQDLPIYTLLVPLYHETESLRRLVRGLEELDYPKEKLDVIFLLEEDDGATVAAARALALPEFIRLVIVPDCQPKTKPKACNVGLAKARGEFLVIYDAEDRPEPDQLKKAVLGFRMMPSDVICLQAKLNFYNRDQNLLTRFFTTEYSMWFDLFLPGLSDLRAPIPLGGTSNHFRVARLRELMGWDPFNVTEDCDLGLRIALKRQQTVMLDTTTWEEACSSVPHWIRQRSRWTKGYIQTFLVASRHPLRMVRQLGLGGTLSLMLMVGGTPFSLLINPIYWILTLGWFIFRLESVSRAFPFPVILWGLFCLFFANFVFMYASLVATYRRGYYGLVKYALLTPLYWALMSVGAWKGFLQLITRPSYWEKTKHGLDLAAHGNPDTASVGQPL